MYIARFSSEVLAIAVQITTLIAYIYMSNFGIWPLTTTKLLSPVVTKFKDAGNFYGISQTSGCITAHYHESIVREDCH